MCGHCKRQSEFCLGELTALLSESYGVVQKYKSYVNELLIFESV